MMGCFIQVILYYNPFHHKKENNDNMLFTLIPGCSHVSKMTQDTFPPFPKAAHPTVLLCNLLLTFYSTKTENSGQKKGL